MSINFPYVCITKQNAKHKSTAKKHIAHNIVLIVVFVRRQKAIA